MADQFPRKTLPSAEVDINSLERHINSTDPHPGVYIDRLNNELSLEHPTLYKDLSSFREFPVSGSKGYNPRLVFYTGATGRDEVTSMTYSNMHPYIYAGASSVISGVTYPVWVDKVSEISGDTVQKMQEMLYIHATDSDTTLSNYHPTLARVGHKHESTDINNFTDKVFDASLGIYIYVVHSKEELETRKIDQAVIVFVPRYDSSIEQIEWKTGYYIIAGRLYRWDEANLCWTDVTAPLGTYTKEQIDALIVKHNSSESPWNHSGLASAVHTHSSDDITDFDEKVEIKVGEKIDSAVDTKLDAHNIHPLAHQAKFDEKENAGIAASLVNAHDISVNAHSAAFAEKADQSDFQTHITNGVIHVTGTERDNWNAKAESTHSHVSGDVSGLTDTLSQITAHVANTGVHVMTADRTTLNNLSGKPYIVAQGSGSNSFYRKWSDKIMEQWGYNTSILGRQWYDPISFPLAFATIPFIVGGISEGTSTTSTYWNAGGGFQVINVTTTTFAGYDHDGGNDARADVPFYWYAIGTYA